MSDPAEWPLTADEMLAKARSSLRLEQPVMDAERPAEAALTTKRSITTTCSHCGVESVTEISVPICPLSIWCPINRGDVK